MIDIVTPSGIGDIYWILSKIYRPAIDAGHKLRIHTPPGANSKASRAKFLEYLDGVESVEPDGISYNDLVKVSKQYDRLQSKMFLECNSWLESGKNLRDYLPQYKTEYVMPWPVVAAPDKLKKRVVVYTSGIINNESKSTGKWTHKLWQPIFDELNKLGVEIYWIGARYDSDMMSICKSNHYWVDNDAVNVIALLRSGDAFISFQSGLSCISVMEKIPTCMLYFRKIEKLINTFTPGGNYKPVFFDDIPIEEVIKWTKQTLESG